MSEKPLPLTRKLPIVGAALLTALAAVAAHDSLTREPSYKPLTTPSPLVGPRFSWEAETAEADASCTELPDKWLMVDWDAADWRILLPLVERGELPHLEALLRNGSYGSLDSFLPSISPAIWTTIATGVSPETHGIRHFYNRQPRLARWWNRLTHFGEADRRLYSNADRRAPAIWNLVSDRDNPVLVVGYHNTFPVEEVEGLIVSNYLTQDSVSTLMQMRPDDAGADLSTSLVYPLEHLDEVLEIHESLLAELPLAVREFVDLDDDELRRFLHSARELDLEGDQRPYFLSRAWLYDQVAAEVAERFYRQIDPTLAIVHFQSLDWAAHHFLYFDRPEEYAEFDWDEETRERLEAQIPLYRDTVVAFYRYADEWLGRLVALTDESTGIVLLSDHGTGPGPDPDLPGYHDDGPPGIIAFSGPGIRRGQRIDGATIYDVLPTLMTGLEAPLAEDLPGRALQEIFCPQALSASHQLTVASYQGSEPYVPVISTPSDLSAGVSKQLESLGYLD